MKRNVTILCLIFSLFPSLFARESLRIGGEAGWGALERVAGAVRQSSGVREQLRLQDAGAEVGQDSQLLLSFDSLPLQDAAGRFRVVQDIEQLSQQEYRYGNAAGVFTENPLVMENRRAELLAPGTQQQEFTISFYLYPSRLSSGEEILRWRGMHTAADGPTMQGLRIAVRNRRLHINFHNMFMDERQQLASVELEGYAGLLPRRWSSHTIRYSTEDGLLEYLVDGVPSAVAYMTPEGRESGGGFPLQIGSMSGRELTLGEGFSGLLDDLHILSTRQEPPAQRIYRAESGRVVTAPVEFDQARTRVTSIEPSLDTPGDTGIRAYYRLGNRIEDGNVAAEWEGIPADGMIPGRDTSRFLQLRFDLLPDGSGQHTPVVRFADIGYLELPPPTPPANLQVESGSGSLRVEWDRVHDPMTGGYRIYYGTRPGQYFGDSAAAGASPVDVPLEPGISAEGRVGVELQGMQPDTLYYIAVVSYDSGDPLLTSAFSREVQGRPLPSEEGGNGNEE